MSSTNASEKTVSDEQSSTTKLDGFETTVEREPAARSACPECEGHMVTHDEESFCADCGLVVAAEWVDRSPTLVNLGMVGNAEQSIETVDPLRTDKACTRRLRRVLTDTGIRSVTSSGRSSSTSESGTSATSSERVASGRSDSTRGCAISR